MARRILATTLLTVAMLAGGLAPAFVPAAAASSCSGWTSESTPPPTIRVYRHATGNVDTVDFETYVKNVLSREWIGSWTAASLQSGALAVRNYAWYQVLHWRGGVNGSGQCFDLRDDTWDQVYDPSQPTWSSAAAAVDATWSWRVYQNGHIFPTYYNAGTNGEACGANANGWKAYQWGTQACGLAGLDAGQIILTYYYPGVTVPGAPTPTPSPTPSATPSATPAPSATASPGAAATPTATATPSPTASPTPLITPTPAPTPPPTPSPTPSPSPVATPSATPTPVPTARLTPSPVPTATATPTVPPTPTRTPTLRPAATPTPAPLATPPADQQLPGGGQANLSNAAAPPPPPPVDPTPVVTTPAPWNAGRVPHQALAAGFGDPSPADPTAQTASTVGGPIDPRLVIFRERIGPAVDELLRSVVARLSTHGAFLALLRLY